MIEVQDLVVHYNVQPTSWNICQPDVSRCIITTLTLNSVNCWYCTSKNVLNSPFLQIEIVINPVTNLTFDKIPVFFAAIWHHKYLMDTARVMFISDLNKHLMWFNTWRIVQNSKTFHLNVL